LAPACPWVLPVACGSRDWILVYTWNEQGLEPMPAFVHLFDNSGVVPTVSASSVSFFDVDTTPYFIGGAVSWDEHADSSSVQEYVVYFLQMVNESDGTAVKHRAGPNVMFGTNELVLNDNTALNNALHVRVYTSNIFGMQVEPAYEKIGFQADVYDNIGTDFPPSSSNGPVADITFKDLDIRVGQVGGIISWSSPPAGTSVTGVGIFFAESSSGAGSAKFGEVGQGASHAVVPWGTVIQGKDVIVLLVLLRAPGRFQAIPAASRLFDNTSVVPTVAARNVQLVDTDNATREIGGTLSWTDPEDTATITSYVVSLAEDASGSGRSQIGEVQYVFGTVSNSFAIPEATPIGSRDHILVHTQNFNGMQVAPPLSILYDLTLFPPSARPASVSFVDTDDRLGFVGGLVSFTEPADVATVKQYAVYFAETATGIARSRIAATVPVGSTQLTIPQGTSRGKRDWILVYAENPIGQASAPAVAVMYAHGNFIPQVQISGMIFKDLNPGRLAVMGDITWQEPGDLATVQSYCVYIASTADGGDKTQVGSDVMLGTNKIELPLTRLNGLAFIVIYTKNIIGRQAVPASLRMVPKDREV